MIPTPYEARDGVGRPGEPAGQPIPVGMWIWLLTLVLWLTWHPFLPRPDPVLPGLRASTHVAEIIGNVALFVPVGGLLAWTGRLRSRRPALTAWLLLAGMCLVVEGGQGLITRRTVSLVDIGTNLSGGAMGLWLGPRIDLRERRVLLFGFAVMLYLSSTGYLLIRSSRASSAFRLDDWRSDFEVLVGNEVGGGRPYVGAIENAGICVPASVEEMCVTRDAELRDRKKLEESAQEMQSVVVFAEVHSLSNQQSGPARIVTFSGGIHERNLTLAQAGKDLLLRIRTPATGPNGARPSFPLPGAVDTGRVTRVRAEFDSATVRMRAVSGDETRSARYRLDGDWRLAWSVAGEVDPRHPGQRIWAIVTGVLVTLLPPGLLAGWALRHQPGRRAEATGSVCTVIVGGTFAHVLSLDAEPAILAAALLLGATAGWLGRRDVTAVSGE